jgi:hypothetical protein
MKRGFRQHILIRVEGLEVTFFVCIPSAIRDTLTAVDPLLSTHQTPSAGRLQHVW